VAVTETARAMTQASLDAYQANGVDQWNWILSDGACPVCEAQRDDNPHELNDTAPPIHPNCRCAVSPIVPGGDNGDA
jgi:SPP1 gp7 family putative phage head morphogenesis protein